MTERETVLLKEFKEKLDKLMDLHLKIKSENRTLKEIIVEKEECIKTLRLQNEEAEKKYELLKMAGSIGGGDQDAHEAKIKINKIVREIDQCIAMLNR
jgi:hypothetical protein